MQDLRGRGPTGYARVLEGVGVVVLKPLSRAEADGDAIYAVIRGGAINQDGRTNGLIGAEAVRAQEGSGAYAVRPVLDRGGDRPEAGLRLRRATHRDRHARTSATLIEAQAAGGGPGRRSAGRAGSPLRDRLGQVEHRPHRGGRGRRRPDQGRPGCSDIGRRSWPTPALPATTNPQIPFERLGRCGRRRRSDPSRGRARRGRSSPGVSSLRVRRDGTRIWSCWNPPRPEPRPGELRSTPLRPNTLMLLPLSARHPEALLADRAPTVCATFAGGDAAGPPTSWRSLAPLDGPPPGPRRPPTLHRRLDPGGGRRGGSDAFTPGDESLALASGSPAAGSRGAPRPGLVAVFSGQGGLWPVAAAKGFSARPGRRPTGPSMTNATSGSGRTRAVRSSRS